jgi:acyl-coenzyme A thioesterase PaaI-like protein
MAVPPAHGRRAGRDDAGVDRTCPVARLLEAIPANEAFGIEVVSAVEGSAEVAMKVAPWMTNVIGSLHPSGLIALVEATGLAALGAAGGEKGRFDEILPLGTVSRLEFLAPARGALRGRCSLGGRDLASLQALLRGRAPRAQIATAVKVLDQDERVVCRGSFTWSLRRTPPTA